MHAKVTLKNGGIETDSGRCRELERKSSEIYKYFNCQRNKSCDFFLFKLNSRIWYILSERQGKKNIHPHLLFPGYKTVFQYNTNSQCNRERTNMPPFFARSEDISYKCIPWTSFIIDSSTLRSVVNSILTTISCSICWTSPC